ncbi:MAG: hypothetical protein NC200_06645 [Candidatus Gastranaerophilales bacterium]|nr:hypothetical protein [Candidatus Gastranaerophilales bacterium]
MSNLNDGVGKKIVEALKKQSEIESSGVVEQPVQEQNSLGVDVSAIDEITNQGLLSSAFEEENNETSDLGDLFADNDFEEENSSVESFNDFMNHNEKQTDASVMPGNIVILKKLIAQLPSGVTRHTGAQIIKQTMEALGISMKSVLTEAQEVQGNLKESSKECQMMIQEYKRKILALEKQTQNFQKQYSALNDLISLFVQTTK